MSDKIDTTALYGRALSEYDYLRVEETARERHEYIAGHAYAMTGSTAAHNRIVSNLHRIFDQHAGGNGCDVFSNDMMLRIEHLNCYYYPDFMLTCENPSPTARFIHSPKLIVEISSPSTAAVDRREKLLAYRQIASLQQYWLIAQDELHVEVYAKSEDAWSFADYKSGDEEILLADMPDADFAVKSSDLYFRLNL